MNRLTLIAAGCALVGVAFGQKLEREAFDAQNDPPAVVQWARGHAPSNGGATSSPNLTWHGGPVLSSPLVTKAIFWGSNWNKPSFVGDKILGIESFYDGVGGSNYAGTNTEYTTGVGGPHVTTAITRLTSAIDLSSGPKGPPRTSQILATVCRNVSGPALVPNGYYAVYVDSKRGGAGYCAWHSAGNCNGTPIEFAFFFNLDGDSGCDPQSALAGSQGLKALINVSGHELSEALTDPKLNAWYDSGGAENSDKCAWTFGSTVTLSNGSQWKIQGNWSNAAYTAGSGYPARVGCIDGN